VSETKIPSLPGIPDKIEPGLKRFLEAVRETILVREGNKGNALDAAVTFRDLVNAGIATSEDYVPKGVVSPVGPAAVSDSTPPPQLEGFTATGSVTSVFVSWDSITNPTHGYVEIWRSVNANELGTAVLVGTSSGQIFVDYDVTAGQDYWYFGRAVSTGDIPGPFNQDGVRAEPSADATAVIQTLEAQGGYAVAGQPYYYVPPTGVTIDGQFIPEGTYLWNAVIANGTITNAMIKNATITSAKIFELTADKITFNSASGQVFSAAVITGGLIQGTQIVGNEIIGNEITGSEINGGTITGTTVNGSIINGGEINVPPATPKFRVDSSGNVTIKSGSTGERLEITNSVIKVYDAAGVVRVRIGNLAG
jgi:hypothetical protein